MLLTIPVLLLLLAFTCASTAVVQHLLTQYVLPAPDGQVAFARQYRVIRRHHESLKSWEDKTAVAMKALRAAVDAFVAESERQGRLERVSRAGIKWSLPSTHPLAVALVLARYPGGPPLLELQRIAHGEVVEVGLDLTRV